MRLDILTPGDFGDSYESREVSFDHEVNCFQDVLNVIKCIFGGMRPYAQGDFRIYSLKFYDDEYELMQEWNFDHKTWELEVIPPTRNFKVTTKNGKLGYEYREPFGHQRYKIPVYYPEKMRRS